MANVRGRIGFGVVVSLLGVILFIVASAYVIDHDYNKIAAAIVGGFAFPVAPLAWHLVAERRRGSRLAAAKLPTKAALTGHDRFWLRFAVVALAVLGPMFASSGFGVFGAAWRHGLWFIPERAPDLGSIGNGPARDFKDQESLLRRVPSDAELVVVFHSDGQAGKPSGTAVLAWGARQAMVAVEGALGDDEPLDKKLEEINADRGKIPFLPVDPFVAVTTSDKTLLIASEGWRNKVEPATTGPSEELRGELARAPQEAPFVAAFAPRTQISAHDLDTAMIRHGAVWGMQHGDSIVIAGRVEARDAAAAKKLADDISAVIHLETKDIPESCRGEVAKIVDRVQIAHDGTIVTARAEIPQDALIGLMFCGMKK